MTDKIFYPETIEEFALPDTVAPEEVKESSSGGGSFVTFTPPVLKEPEFPPINFAVEVLSKTLNTKNKKILGEYTFGTMGAISIGVYENGVSGDIRITPDGITARNVNGTTTFSIDGTTGDAVFLGTITAGALVTGSVTVQGQGAFIVNDGTYDRILMGYQLGGF